MAKANRRVLRLKIGEFDTSVLPEDARSPDRAAFRNAASQFLRKQFRQLDGVIETLVFGPEEIEVTWVESPDSPGPSGPIVKMLEERQCREAILLMRLFLSDTPDDTGLLYNLGMALSDAGQIEEAIGVLRRLLVLEPDHINGRVALGVALTRVGDNEGAAEELRRAAEEAPNNPWAQRNLGAALLKLGLAQEAVEPLRVATEVNPQDERAWYGLGQALELTGDRKGADEAYRKVLSLDEYGEAARLTREALSRLAQKSFEAAAPGVPRMGAVMYCLDALERFEKMTPDEVQKVGVEIAILGTSGLDVNDPTPKYRLRALPGEFSGLHLVSIEYVAFKQITPDEDIGFDLSREYEMALGMQQRRGLVQTS